MKKYQYILKNLDCANCANKIQLELAKNAKLKNVVVNFSTLKLTYESENEEIEEVKKIVNKIKPEVELVEISKKNQKQDNKITMQIIRLIIGVLIAIIGWRFNIKIAIILAYAILLYRTAKNAYKLLRQSKTINENFLVTISCIGAYLVGEHLEGLMVIILYEIGKILEEKAINKTRKSISDLMDIKPEYANLKIGNETKKVSPEELKINDIILIKQGEKVPIDGIVIKGRASLNMASLTGESNLVEIKENDEILSGSIVADGMLEIEVTKEYANSTVNKILDLVENATDKKAKTETFVNKAARIYTPVVLILAIIVATILPLVSNIQYAGKDGSIYRALIFLVISCPCAIAISVPLSYFSGIGKSSKSGILIKGSDYLDAIKDISEIIFDKTGTLTKGEFSIKKVETYNSSFTEKDILKYAVLGEKYSNHPIAKSIVKNAEIEVEQLEIQDYKEIAGKGISYKIDGKEVLIGNSNLVQTKNEEEDGTQIHIKINDELVGTIILADKIKEDAKHTIENLRKMGINAKMFTGDKSNVAKTVAEELGITDVKSEMLPTDKYKELEDIIKQYKGTNKKVAFVGDGINDSPVLALADIGISMGGVGQESAIEASDVVIMTDKLEKIVEAIKISKYTSKIIKQNLIFAIGIKVFVLLLSVLGFAQMWQAVFADVGVTVLAILNTLRILK